MKRTYREPCGCTYKVRDDRERWDELCPKHKAEADEIHERWGREHAEQREREKAEGRK